jgi:probable rRNA maturation factor
MRFEIEINNVAKSPVEKNFFQVVGKKFFQELPLEKLNEKKISLSLALVTEKEIKSLNKKFRGLNQTTDILSFAEYKNFQQIALAPDKEIFLGELILCYNDIEKYVKRKKLNLRTELANVFAHGILHLLGFRHGVRMFSLQKQISQKFF